MIRLAHRDKTFEFGCAVDCVLGQTGWGSPLEWPAIIRGDLRPDELTVISKTITDSPITGWPWDPLLRVRHLGNHNWVNAFGLLNPGRDQGEDILRRFSGRVGQAIVSVFAANSTEAIHLALMVDRLSDIIAVELNVSCPNVHPLTLEEIENIVGAFRAICSLPMIVKLGFDQDYVAIAQLLGHTVDALHVTNTVRWDTVFPGQPSPLMKYGGGGVSGPIIFPYALRCVQDLREAGIETQILAGGGVDSTYKARRLIEEGADAVAVSTYVHHDPKFPHQLERYLKPMHTWRDLQSR